MSDIEALSNQIKDLSQQFTTEIGGVTARLTVLEDRVSEVPKSVDPKTDQSPLGDNRSNLHASGTTWPNFSGGRTGYDNLLASGDTSARLGQLHLGEGMFGKSCPPTPALSPTQQSDSCSASEDFETQFAHIRSSVSNISLNKDLEVSSAKKSIKKPDHTAVDILGKCGSYAATSLKVLASYKEGNSVEELMTYLYYINMAQIRYLQAQKNSLAVKGGFNPNTASVFDMLQNNTLKLNEQAVNNLETAARLSAVMQPTGNQAPHKSGPYGRQNYRNNNQQQDTFSAMASRSFPGKKSQHAKTQGSDSSEKSNQE